MEILYATFSSVFCVPFWRNINRGNVSLKNVEFPMWNFAKDWNRKENIAIDEIQDHFVLENKLDIETCFKMSFLKVKDIKWSRRKNLGYFQLFI